MGRILAIDYGRKRTGIAVTDPLQIIANGLETIPTHSLLNYLKSYFNREKVDEVVIGYPKQMNNLLSESVIYVDGFIKLFRKNFPNLDIHLIDERFTSKIAMQTMIDGGLKKQQRKDKTMIDKISATIILQSYLEEKRNKQK